MPSILDVIRRGDLGALRSMPALDPRGSDAQLCTAMLSYACTYKQAAVAQWLIEQGSEVNDTNSNGSTALHAASYSGECVGLLLAAGAVVDKATPMDDARFPGVTALYVASECGLMGSSPFEAAQIINFNEHLKELSQAYRKAIPYGTDPSEVAEAVADFFDNCCCLLYSYPPPCLCARSWRVVARCRVLLPETLYRNY